MPRRFSAGLYLPDPSQTYPMDDPSSVMIGQSYDYCDIPVTVEYCKGDIRSGTSPSGVKWETPMPAVYGCIPGLLGADHEDLDVYINPDPHDDSAPVHIIDQINPKDKSFDEHKVVFGYVTTDAIHQMWNDVFLDGSGPDRLGALSTLSMEEFKSWSKGDLKQPYAYQPATEDVKIDVTQEIPQTPDRSALQVVTFPRLTKVPQLISYMQDGHLKVDVLIMTNFKSDDWGSFTDNLITLLYTAQEGDKVTIALCSPGGEVDLAARIASAIRATKAEVTTIAIGMCASAACLTWCEGHIRQVTPGSFLMQHMSSHQAMGHSVSIVLDGIALVNYVKRVILKRAVEIKLLSEDEVDDLTVKGRDIFLSAQQVQDRTGAELVERWQS